MNIFLGVAVARWSFVNQRDREVELIWRGEQYSRALKCYLQATGVPPSELEDLVEENCIRRLYTDPMTSSGEWKILRAADLGEEGRKLVAGLIEGGGEAPGDEAELEVEADAEDSGMPDSSLLGRLRSRRAQRGSTSGESDAGMSSGLGQEGQTSGLASRLGQKSGGSERKSLRERAEGRFSDRLAARDLTGGRGRSRANEADMMASILGVVTSGSGEAIRTYMEKSRYEDWYFTLAGNLQQDGPLGPQLPGAGGLPPGGAGGTEIQGETDERKSRFRRPSLRRGG